MSDLHLGFDPVVDLIRANCDCDRKNQRKGEKAAGATLHGGIFYAGDTRRITRLSNGRELNATSHCQKQRRRGDECADQDESDCQPSQILAKHPPSVLRRGAPQTQHVDEEQRARDRARLIARRLQPIEKRLGPRGRFRIRQQAERRRAPRFRR